MDVTTRGIDLAKNVFQLHGVDENSAVALSKRVSSGARGRGVGEGR